MHITHEMNMHNCQLCKYEFLDRCLHVNNHGKDVSLENEPCSNYKFAGSDERLKEIQASELQ